MTNLVFAYIVLIGMSWNIINIYVKSFFMFTSMSTKNKFHNNFKMKKLWEKINNYILCIDCLLMNSRKLFQNDMLCVFHKQFSKYSNVREVSSICENKIMQNMLTQKYLFPSTIFLNMLIFIATIYRKFVFWTETHKQTLKLNIEGWWIFSLYGFLW